MEKLLEILNYNFEFGGEIHIKVKHLLFVVFVFIITTYILKWVYKIATKKLPLSDKVKFRTVFSFVKYFVYIVVCLITLDNMGINVTAILAASTALLVGVGLALRTFFQDIIAGVFILIDQTVHVGDILELDGKVGKVTDIKLRTTRAVTLDNKVVIIPNHKYLTSSLYNWTENGETTRENVTVGVAYGTDLELVKDLLLNVALRNKSVLKYPEPIVLFTDFGDSALQFKLIFTLNNSFEAVMVKSDIRFEIDKVFREHNITIPFPQREIYLNTNN
ncbi:mechanosensitive ion channel family protein [Pseudofulvibacter geojedonensis]|uniref:Mechanosensitive ion channel family protein n=1 Tax=Pseudofulvibacter geojedonensis TaxID=1123758 RepID=A0ABW3HYU2_9FLAO